MNVSCTVTPIASFQSWTYGRIVRSHTWPCRDRLPQREALARGDQIERLVDSGLLIVEQQFRNVIGHRQIPLLLSSIAPAV